MSDFQRIEFELYSQVEIKRTKWVLYCLIGVFLAGTIISVEFKFKIVGILCLLATLLIAMLRWLHFMELELSDSHYQRIPEGRKLIFDADGISIDSKENFFISTAEIQYIPLITKTIIFRGNDGTCYMIRNCKKSKAVAAFEQFRDQVWMPYQEAQLDPTSPRLDFRLRFGGGLNMVLFGKKDKHSAPQSLSPFRMTCYVCAFPIIIFVIGCFVEFEDQLLTYAIAVMIPILAFIVYLQEKSTAKLKALTTEYQGVMLSPEGMHFYGGTELTIPWKECQVLRSDNAELLFRWQNRKYSLEFYSFILPIAARRYLTDFAEKYVMTPTEGGNK